MIQNYPPDIANNVAGKAFKSWLLAAVVAGTDVGEFTIGSIGPYAAAGMTIGGGTLTLQAGAGTFTANDTNYTTITVNKRTAGGAAVPIAIGSTALTSAVANATGSMAAWSNVKLTKVAGAFVSPGDVLTVAITHGGSGLAVPASILEIFPQV